MDPRRVAAALGFTDSVENSIDGTAARDVVAEFSFICAQIGIDISRLSEEIVIWNTKEFGYVTLDDSYSTGSSIMPQKKNPDVAELIRGKTGRVNGNLVALLTVMKGLPLAYNKDMQEDKEGVFDSVSTALASLEILKQMLKTAKFNEQNMLAMTRRGHLTATDLADYLVREKNVPFRQAHFITGKAVAYSENLGLDLSELNAQQLASVDESLDAGAVKFLDLNASKEARKSQGGTANESVAAQIEILNGWLKG